jgi:hypothetical protein
VQRKKEEQKEENISTLNLSDSHLGELKFGCQEFRNIRNAELRFPAMPDNRITIVRGK